VRCAVLALLCLTAVASADTSKIAKDDTPIEPTQPVRGRNKLCCGYPLAEELGFALRFYWLALEEDYDDPPPSAKPIRVPAGPPGKPTDTWTEIYTRDGYFMQRIPEKFAWGLRLEGSGLMRDGRVINYTGPCRFGYGTCFEQLDIKDHPFGRGAGQRPLIPFKSVAVDPRIVKIGEPIYIPEFDGLTLPDGSLHDGCVRADDTGGGIKKRKMDFFVVTYGNFRMLLDQLNGVTWMTPHVESPRCEYLRDL